VTPRGDGSAGYVRDNVRYGVTEGRFRGRWWNYYDRGRSFLDGGFWKEAERDLRIALGSRKRDQLWPRTYGLHFIPEYFPHRELGIALYHQGRLPEAIRELELSISHKMSARGALFLDDARKKFIESQGADQNPPTVELMAIASTVSERTVTVKGVARDDTYVAGITIAGKPVTVRVSAPEIPFDEDVALLPRENQIEVAVTDLSGKTAVTHARVVADLDGPALSFDTPIALPGVVKGVAYDPAGVASVSIGGKPAEMSVTDDGMVSFSVTIPEADIRPPFPYESRDSLGNITRGRLPVSTVVVSGDPVGVTFAAYHSPVFVESDSAVAVIVNNLLVLSAKPSESAAAGLRLGFANLREGQKLRLDEVVVSLEIDSQDPVDQVSLNGIPLETIQGRTAQRIARRVPLELGSNALVVAARDTAGHTAESTLTVVREPTPLDQPQTKLNVAFLGNVWRGNSPKLEGEADFILDAVSRELYRHRRFGEIVDRQNLPEILAEQELSAALGKPETRLTLGKIIPAEVMIIGRVRRDAETIEIVVEGFSTETSRRVMRADVAGRADDLDQLDRLARDLALSIIQELPRVSGNVALAKSDAVFVSNLGEADLIRESMKYVVYRLGEDVLDPNTGESLGRDIEIVGEALVNLVEARKSTAEIVSLKLPPGAKVGDQLVTK